ncbi:hypothetical protein [Franconibacter helveticus]|uniref:hypothetical protein n=1 Tax=Franconibacter helveticus TaxID=357240 RepID=UPI0029099B1E|nr:hypothetical protein [Franconibacter helveticus]MDU6923999.1 hypothetical protein [Franconibacter helveticus]
MKVVNLELPESGLVVIDCEKRKIITAIAPQKIPSGKNKSSLRVLFTREIHNDWRCMFLRKNEFVCSLKSLKDIISMVAKKDDSNFWLK